MTEKEKVKAVTEETKELNTNQQLVALSALIQRANLASRLGQQFGGKRDIYNALGYKKDLTYDDYYNCYDRQDIAGRVVDMPASATWRNVPKIKEDDDEEKDTAFEEAWKGLSKRLKVWHYMERADRLAGIGRYAVLVIGVRGSGTLSDPLEKSSLKKPEDIIYLSPFSERSAEIATWETDPGSPRFGRPLTYKIDFAGDLKGSVRFTAGQQIVHHTRVIHVADGLLEDEVFGRPRLRRVINLFYDMAKVAGGSAEMFWQGAFRGLHADLRDEHELGPDDEKNMTTEIDEYIHGLRRYIRTQGIDLKTLGGETPDPRGVFEVLISLISGATGIPKRILIGSERGELSSSQDETNFNSYIHERQIHFAEPMVLRPFIDKLIEFGALPEPKEPYKVEWPNLFELDDKDKAEIADKKAATIQKYASTITAEEVVPIPEFREKILGLDREPSEEDIAYLQKRLADDLDGDDAVDDEFRQRVRGNRERKGDGR